VDSLALVEGIFNVANSRRPGNQHCDLPPTPPRLRTHQFQLQGGIWTHLYTPSQKATLGGGRAGQVYTPAERASRSELHYNTMDKKHEDAGGVAQIDKTSVFQEGRATVTETIGWWGES
jgi:hypothetical protein